jgi:chemotaxis protein MotA
MEHGHLAVLFQPAELVIIGGAAAGATVIANPIRVLKAMMAGLIGLLKSDPSSKARYLDTLKMLHDLFASARKNGAQRLEADIEKPAESPVLSQFPTILKDHHAMDYMCDSLRLVLMGGVSSIDMEQMMEIDADSHHDETAEPVAALQTLADSLPGLGIVAAVLGVVITMGALGGPPEEIGHKVAAALVGTFLGILLCYGFVGPLSSMLSKRNDAHAQYLVCIRTAVLAYVRGCGPLMCAEFARRSVPPHMRPSFQQMEAALKGGAAAPAAEQKAA